MPVLPDHIPIGELAARSGVATSALRFYEARGLIAAERTAGNQRVYPRPTLRRVAFIRAAQEVGLTLDEIGRALASLPSGRTPLKQDWERLSRPWRDRVGERIADLERLRDRLTGCIGCGCLSLRTCRLLNRDDRLAASGAGARYLLGGEAQDSRDVGKR
ncbi:MAG: redox-sensitive transcriptional activator SoxR [Chloroflexota bacterium]|nr:redox-sensitive transcriptional activator SoxR [Chloroflexota bacterium]MDQ3688723.1 redox-sensitive transcriptional activator SoxR [Chloroflexota bacterium]